jgi:hypothetical protein
MIEYTDMGVKNLEETIFANALKAARNPENLLEDGTPNWNWVDSDSYIDTLNDSRYPREMVEAEFYNLFDGVCFHVQKVLNNCK